MGSVSLRWVEQQLFTGTDSHEHSFVIGKLHGDPPSWLGIKPSDLLLLAVASCSAMDLVEILTKQREPLKDLLITVSGEQNSQPPYSFTQIHLHYRIWGPVDAKKLERAITLSEDKYCSVISTLRPGVPVTSDYEILGGV